MDYHKEQGILKFIENFKDATDTFSYGCCYWFAVILQERFRPTDWDDPWPIIMYDQVANHFGCLIGTRTYDVTGDVSLKYNWEPWLQVETIDPLLASRIKRDCILKIEGD